MSEQSITQRLHRLLAASYPEPIDRADLVRRLGLPVRALDRALERCRQAGVVRRVRPLSARHGYAYTVET
jgi:DNA-binding transcriptional regulator LsrR (DeoR family)